MVRTIIVTVGLPGAGKGTFADVAKSLGIPVLVMGDVVREEANKRNLELTSANLRAVARELREKYGDDVLAKRIIEKIDSLYKDKCVVLVDGCRTPSELAIFKKYAKVVVVSIEAPFEVRASRIAKRGRTDDIGNVKKIVAERDEAEIKLGVKEVMAEADIVIVNEGSLEEFLEKARSVLEKILSESC